MRYEEGGSSHPIPHSSFSVRHEPRSLHTQGFLVGEGTMQWEDLEQVGADAPPKEISA